MDVHVVRTLRFDFSTNNMQASWLGFLPLDDFWVSAKNSEASSGPRKELIDFQPHYLRVLVRLWEAWFSTILVWLSCLREL